MNRFIETLENGWIKKKCIESMEIVYQVEGSGCWVVAKVWDDLATKVDMKLRGFMDERTARSWIEENFNPATDTPDSKNVTISFDLFNYDEMSEFKTMMKARDYFCVIHDIVHRIVRSQWKHAEHKHQETWDVVEEIRAGIQSALEDYDIDV